MVSESEATSFAGSAAVGPASFAHLAAALLVAVASSLLAYQVATVSWMMNSLLLPTLPCETDPSDLDLKPLILLLFGPLSAVFFLLHPFLLRRRLCLQSYSVPPAFLRVPLPTGLSLRGRMHRFPGCLSSFLPFLLGLHPNWLVLFEPLSIEHRIVWISPVLVALTAEGLINPVAFLRASFWPPLPLLSHSGSSAFPDLPPVRSSSLCPVSLGQLLGPAASSLLLSLACLLFLSPLSPASNPFLLLCSDHAVREIVLPLLFHGSDSSRDPNWLSASEHAFLCRPTSLGSVPLLFPLHISDSDDEPCSARTFLASDLAALYSCNLLLDTGAALSTPAASVCPMPVISHSSSAMLGMNIDQPSGPF